MALADQEIISGMMEVWEPSLQRDPRQDRDLEDEAPGKLNTFAYLTVKLLAPTMKNRVGIFYICIFNNFQPKTQKYIL